MLIDINDVRRREKPLFVESALDLADIKVKEDLAQVREPVQIACRISSSGKKVRVKGEVVAQLELTCSRCLGAFQRRVEKRFDLDYEVDPEVDPENDEVALTYDELSVGFYRNDELDLRVVAAEQVFLEVPMKPVCMDGCKGLCDQCGVDLNKDSCSCERTTIDPRLAVLADLKKKFEN
jgi:uncharacterized protein